MTDFLLELLSEEIPARMQAKARNDLARLFAECTGEAGLATGAIDSLFDAAAAGADRARCRGGDRGEPRGAEGPALIRAAAGARGIPAQDRPDARSARRARRRAVSPWSSGRGGGAAEILAEAVKRIVADFPWPKSMRWGDGDAALGAAAARHRRHARRGHRAGRDRRHRQRRDHGRPSLPPSRADHRRRRVATTSRSCAPAT